MATELCPRCHGPLTHVTGSRACAAEYRRWQNRQDPYHGQPTPRLARDILKDRSTRMAEAREVKG